MIFRWYPVISPHTTVLAGGVESPSPHDPSKKIPVLGYLPLLKSLFLNLNPQFFSLPSPKPCQLYDLYGIGFPTWSIDTETYLHITIILESYYIYTRNVHSCHSYSPSFPMICLSARASATLQRPRRAGAPPAHLRPGQIRDILRQFMWENPSKWRNVVKENQDWLTWYRISIIHPNCKLNMEKI